MSPRHRVTPLSFWLEWNKALVLFLSLLRRTLLQFKIDPM